jgi:hypothetical protein
MLYILSACTLHAVRSAANTFQQQHTLCYPPHPSKTPLLYVKRTQLSLTFFLLAFIDRYLLLNLQAGIEPLTNAAALASTGDNRLWARMVAALNLTVDEDQAYVTMLVPTDRVRMAQCCVTCVMEVVQCFLQVPPAA